MYKVLKEHNIDYLYNFIISFANIQRGKLSAKNLVDDIDIFNENLCFGDYKIKKLTLRSLKSNGILGDFITMGLSNISIEL